MEDDFDTPVLDRSLWYPYYLPQWSTSDQAAARYELSDGCLHLLIEADQPPWCSQLDGPTRVSSLQTGVFSGRLGSSVGQHRFHPDAVVTEVQPPLRLYTPQYGVFMLRARLPTHPECMAALWMIGYEDRPERSGEICICEVFGHSVTATSARVGMGIHPFADPALVDDFAAFALALDVTAFHDYAAEWTPELVRFFVDGELVRTVAQSPSYPMQLMVGIYQFGDPQPGDTDYPKRFSIDWFRSYRRS